MDNNHAGSEIRRYRRHLEVTQLTLAKLTGIHFSRISMIENGHYEARPDELVKIALALGLPRDLFLPKPIPRVQLTPKVPA